MIWFICIIYNFQIFIFKSSLLEIKDLLKDPKARSVDAILGKNKQALNMIKTFLKETEDSKSQLVIKEGKCDECYFEFIGKRRESKKKIEAFSIIFKEDKYKFISNSFIFNIPSRISPRKLNSYESFDSIINELDPTDQSFPKFRKNTLTKVKKLLSARNLNPKRVLGENAVC